MDYDVTEGLASLPAHHPVNTTLQLTKFACRRTGGYHPARPALRFSTAAGLANNHCLRAQQGALTATFASNLLLLPIPPSLPSASPCCSSLFYTFSRDASLLSSCSGLQESFVPALCQRSPLVALQFFHSFLWPPAWQDPGLAPGDLIPDGAQSLQNSAPQVPSTGSLGQQVNQLSGDMIAQHSACFHLGTSFHHSKSRHRPFHRLFFPGHIAHDPTKDRAPAYSFRGTKAPSTDSCSPGPRYFIHPSITKTGKYMPPSALMMGRSKSKIEVTPGPSDYLTELANKHVFYTAPSNHMVFRPNDLKRFRTPGPGTYTLPRILGPNTAYTHAQPCYSMKGKSQYQSCFQDVAKTPGPAAFAKVDLDVYKTRAPKFSMGLKTKLAGKDRFPGPADYNTGKVALIKARDPAYSFGLRHSIYKASLIPATHVD
ncbi:uncharacterized protein LOC129121953 isoform X1 [Agelaius phoeniceus]|uniref:uncharacterized protein LOC129121953 isoform X1 n=1 Tax=Agelaius phoeniceus TaxID=39638 RepID=UPI004054EE3D